MKTPSHGSAYFSARFVLGMTALLASAACSLPGLAKLQPHSFLQRPRPPIIRPIQRPTTVVAAANPNKARALKPNLDISVYRRCFAPNETVHLSLSAFNAPSVQFAAYSLDLGSVVKTSVAMQDFSATLRALPLSGRKPAATWRVAVKILPDQWASADVKMPKLAPGAYLLVASTTVHGAFVEKRTWIAVTGVTLLAKRSLGELLVYAADVNSGRPVSKASLRLCDENGRFSAAQSTNANGLLRTSATGANGSLWVYGATPKGPAFAMAAGPDAPDPFAVYTVTDRPIYRPGNLVQYKATIRQRVENGDAPGGFDWKPYAAQSADLEIRDATDALIEQHTITTDANGALSGSIQLAAEPSLGDWHLVVVLGKDKRRVYSTFSVQAYRKPEMNVTVKFDHEHYLGGSPIPVTINAQYFFGRPVTDARVRYQVSFSQQSGYGVHIEPDYNAVGSTDAQGHLTINIPTKRAAADRQVSVQATVTDLSRRSAQGDGSTLATGGLYRLSLGADKSVYHPGERIAITAAATDYDDKPVAGARVRIQMVEHKEDNQRRPYNETTTRDVTTGADGTTSANFSTPREGSLDFHAESYDSQQDKITADTQVQVTTDKQQLAYAQPTPPILALGADKNEYSPGQTAQLTIDTLLTHRPAQPAEKVIGGVPARPARNEAWALVTLEGENLGEARVIHLTGRKTIMPIPLAVRDFPSTTVNVAIIQDRQLYEQQQTLTVLMPGKALNVSITPDKRTYQPGDTATYTISARDSGGTEVAADISLGVVDASIYDIQADNSEDMKDVFYNGQTVRLTSSYSFAAQYSGGGYQVVEAPMAMKAEDRATSANLGFIALAPPPGIRVRNQFADTAYWNAGVETGADGTAQVAFTVPDNLTKWRATARAITPDTKIGSATNDVVSVMPLLVRLELPRFVVQGDKTVVSAIIQNGTADARTVHVKMAPQGATADASSALQQTIALPANGQQRIDWPVTIGTVRQASFTVTADGGAGGQDAAQSALPVYPNGAETVTALAFTLSGSDMQQSIDLTRLPAGASLLLTLSPSLASGVTDAVNDLAEKPVGDAGETADALAADVAAARALRDAGKSSVIAPNQDLSMYVSTALQKLYRYQHPDGGWNWWEFDQTDGDMTASILGSLAQTKASGIPVDNQRLLRGADALRRLLKDDEDLDSRADWLLTLSEVAPSDAEAPLLELYGERDKLGAYSRASLALGLAHAGAFDAKSDATEDAKTVAAELADAATVEGRATNWPLQPGDTGCLWSGDDVALTAHVLRALLTISPSDEHIPGAARWLMANRAGKSWDSTHASAEAVLALSQYIEQTGELAPSYTARTLLDGTDIGTLTASPQSNSTPLTLNLAPEQLAGHKTLTIQREGSVGALYVSEVTTSLTPPIAAVPQRHGITVKRQFRLAVDNPALSSSIPSGSGMDVTLDIDADTDYRYVKVEDHLPSGFEVTSGDTDDNNPGGSAGDGGFPIDFSDGNAGYARQQTRDDRVEFDFDSLPKGHTQLTYHLSAETPGLYNIRDAQAAVTYQPEVRGSTILAQVAVGE